MEISYSLYSLTPLKRANRSSTLEPKYGVFLRAKTKNGVSYADYFPQSSFGDKGRDHFLEEFKLQKDVYSQKIHHLLLKDHEYQTIPQKKFFNHQLWTGTEDLASPIIKYKLPTGNDRTFLDPLKRGIKVRLDANAQFTKNNFESFLKTIPTELLGLIDYVEDPLIDVDWSNLGINAATDIIAGSPYYARIHRPNCKFFQKEEAKIIFSSYLGADLGRWHTYCELVEHGDLNEVHGIISTGFIKEEKSFISGNYQDGFSPIKEAVINLYQDLNQLSWNTLCSI